MIRVAFHAHELAHAHDIMRIAKELNIGFAGKYEFFIICTSEVAFKLLRQRNVFPHANIRFIPEFRMLAHLKNKEYKKKSLSSRDKVFFKKLKLKLLSLSKRLFLPAGKKQDAGTSKQKVEFTTTVAEHAVTNPLFSEKRYVIPDDYYSFSDMYRELIMAKPKLWPLARHIMKFLRYVFLLASLLYHFYGKVVTPFYGKVVTPFKNKWKKKFALLPWPLGLFLYWQKRLVFYQLAKWLPDCIILTEENTPYGTGIFIAYAKRKKIPILVIPYANTPPMELAAAYSRIPTFLVNDSRLNRLTAKVFPQWVCRNLGELVLVHGPEIIWPYELNRLAAPHPIYLQSAPVDKVLVESVQMYDFYAQYKVERKRMQIVGSAWGQELKRIKSEKQKNYLQLCDEYSLNNTRELALVALPPFVPMPKFDIIKAFVPFLQEFINAALPLAERFELLFCLHPRMRNVKLKNIDYRNIPIFKDDTAQAISMASMYMACVSETIRWAIACGLPVLNYDIFDLRYTHYSNMRAVLSVYNYNEAEQTARRLATDKDFFARMQNIQTRDSKFYAGIDMDFTTNLDMVINEQIKDKMVKRQIINI